MRAVKFCLDGYAGNPALSKRSELRSTRGVGYQQLPLGFSYGGSPAWLPCVGIEQSPPSLGNQLMYGKSVYGWAKGQAPFFDHG